MPSRVRAAWLLVLVLFVTTGLRTTVLGYCLCAERLLLDGPCCCESGSPEEDMCGTPRDCDVDCDSPCGESNAIRHSGNERSKAQDFRSCKGDIYLAFDIGDYVQPTPRSEHEITRAQDMPGSPSMTWSGEVQGPRSFVTGNRSLTTSLSAPPPPGLSRDQLQSWLI